ncbi:MAG TPA: amino acid permease [Verrucomicrobiae bacterium]|nr:amino acid permease [Verrucomicrobiae bacterium]
MKFAIFLALRPVVKSALGHVISQIGRRAGRMMSLTQLFRRKSLDKLVGETTEPQHQLQRALGPLQLTLLGVGAIVGAGIFSSVGTAAAGDSVRLGAGPALVISLLLVTVACGFAALCYAEFAAMVPVSGSAYTYAYATLGELAAWLIGWDLILEYAISNAAVAVSWSGYFQSLLSGFHLDWPAWLGTDFRSAIQSKGRFLEGLTNLASLSAGVPWHANVDLSGLADYGTRDLVAYASAPAIAGVPIIFNLPAFLIVVMVTWVVLIGIRETAHFNTAVTLAKIGIILFFLAVGATCIDRANWAPFAPNGFKGISGGAAIIFFAYIGFDAVTTASEETRRPQRDMPIGILASLAVCTVLYVAVAIVLTGMSRWTTLGTAEPLADAFLARGMKWAAAVTALGGVLATTSALIPYQAGQPRIFFSMGRDGLLPGWAAKVHPRFRTPYVTTIITGVIVALCSSVASIGELVDLTNIGTLFAFSLVAAGIVILRYADPERPRPFRTPLVPWIPVLAIICCGYLMSELPSVTWLRFFLWMLAGLVLYVLYGFRRSRLGSGNNSDTRQASQSGRLKEGR